jgi:hypothetical protein
VILSFAAVHFLSILLTANDALVLREIITAEVEDRETIPYDDDFYTELASKYASTAAKEKKMAPEW